MLLKSQLEAGLTLISQQEDTINGEHCWTFTLGENNSDLFHVTDYFAVSDTGKVYVMDIISGDYIEHIY